MPPAARIPSAPGAGSGCRRRRGRARTRRTPTRSSRRPRARWRPPPAGPAASAPRTRAGRSGRHSRSSRRCRRPPRGRPCRRARHPPPLTGGDDDREGEEEEADAVAAVLRLEVATGVADLAGHGTGGVGQAHPRALHGSQRQGQATAAGAGRALARPGSGSPGRGAGRRGAAARRGGRTSRHGRRLRAESHQTHLSHAHDAALSCGRQASMTVGMIIGRRRIVRPMKPPTERRITCCSS